MKNKLFAVLFMPAIAWAQTVDVRDFVSYDIGDSWTYSGSVSQAGQSASFTTTITNIGTTFTSDGDAVEVEASITLNGETQTASSAGILSAEGLKIVEVSQGSFSTTRYSPAKRELPRPLVIGQTTTSSGDLSSSSDSGTYDVRTTIEGIETVTVPAGTFQALRVRIITTEVLNSFFEGTINYRVDATRWYVRGIGQIKETSTRSRTGEANSTNTTQLTSTTRPLLNLPVEGAPPLLGEAVSTGGGWYYSPWLGAVNVNAVYGWYFQQGLGALYSGSNNSEGPIWMYIAGLNWVYTTSDIFPSMYSTGREAWVLWNVSTDPSVRVFYDFKTQEFFVLN